MALYNLQDDPHEDNNPLANPALKSLGTRTFKEHIGKLGVRIRTVKNGKATKHPIYETDIDSKLLAKEGLAEWGKDWVYELDGIKLDKPIPSVEFFITPDGKVELTNPALESMSGYQGQSKRIDEKYDVLRHYNNKKPRVYGSQMIVAGVSPKPAGQTRDSYYSSVFVDYLENVNRKFSVGSKTLDGVDSSKPLFCHIGYDCLDGFDMARIAEGALPARDYVIGESHAVTGPRAYIRTKNYVFSMQTRPDKNRGRNLDWVRNASYRALDPALYHMPSDPHEVKNLAFSKEYERVAMAMKEKLMNIVMGDGRIEVDWGAKADGTEVFTSNFAPGADDKKLKL